MTRGRPRKYDRDKALHSAMTVFWGQGYEGAQLSDLMSAMGVSPPTFYAAFESKEALYREALALYLRTAGALAAKVLCEADTPRDGVEAMLMAGADAALASPSAGGCMVSLGLVNSSLRHTHLRDHVVGVRVATTTLIRQRLEEAVRHGDLSVEEDLTALSEFYSAVLRSLSLLAQDGASRDTLVRVVTTAMRAWPGPLHSAGSPAVPDPH